MRKELEATSLELFLSGEINSYGNSFQVNWIIFADAREVLGSLANLMRYR